MARILHQRTRSGLRARVVLAAAAVATVIAGLPWMLRSFDPDDGPSRAAMEASWQAAAREAAWPPSAAQAAPLAGRAASIARAASLPRDPARSGAASPGCGPGPEGLARAADRRPQPLTESVQDAARHLLAVSMSTHPGPRTRAAALLLQLRQGLDADALAEAREQDLACRQAIADGLAGTAQFCRADAARRQAELFAPWRPQIDQLARLAARSDDPVIRGFAQEACEPAGLSLLEPPSSCQLAGAAAWARAAPQSAEPWLLLAAQAEARGQREAASQALAQAASARQIDEGVGALAVLASEALPEGLSHREQAAALAQATALEPGAHLGALAAAQTLCTGPSLRAPGRLAACEALAERMARQGRAADTVGTGVQIAERLGWPAEHTSALWREQQAALGARQRFLAGDDALTCEGLQRQRLVVTLTAQLGEIEAGRRLMSR